MKAIVLLSGGLDSSTVLAIAKERGFECYALSFDYGQRHRGELEAASAIAAGSGCREHRVVRVDLSVGGSALTTSMAVPKDRSVGAMSDGIPCTYVPARNLIFLAHAVAWAEVLEATDIFAGMNALDYSGYPDCRPAFIEAFQAVAREGTRLGSAGRSITVHTPLIAMTKAEIVREGTRLGLDLGQTRSCYDPTPEGFACRRCDSCILRARGFAEAHIPDPTRYAA